MNRVTGSRLGATSKGVAVSRQLLLGVGVASGLTTGVASGLTVGVVKSAFSTAGENENEIY